MPDASFSGDHGYRALDHCNPQFLFRGSNLLFPDRFLEEAQKEGAYDGTDDQRDDVHTPVADNGEHEDAP